MNRKSSKIGPDARSKQNQFHTKESDAKVYSSGDSSQSSNIMEDLYLEMEDREAMTSYYRSLPSQMKKFLKGIISLDCKIR